MAVPSVMFLSVFFNGGYVGGYAGGLFELCHCVTYIQERLKVGNLIDSSVFLISSHKLFVLSCHGM